MRGVDPNGDTGDGGGILSEGEYMTLALLEVTGPARPTATHKRSYPVLGELIDAGYVEVFGSIYESTRVITEVGREALRKHREAGPGGQNE